ncbi:AI-2E family transporter [Luminiphilus sp.]|nr:AI-2E family transporter [Luminiphilus sp.]MDA9722201.1 AI-2E family transporter [Luminiphilus sp.]
MKEVLTRWYQRYLSEEEAVILLVMLTMAFAVMLFFGDILAPVLVAIVLAYLMQGVANVLRLRGLPRELSVAVSTLLFLGGFFAVLFGLAPLVWRQLVALVREAPAMIEAGRKVLVTLPEEYPVFFTQQQVNELTAVIQAEMASVGQLLVTKGLSSIPSVLAAIVYLILIPLMVFFFLKDREQLTGWFTGFLPAQKPLLERIWAELNLQFANYARGKGIEVLIIGGASYVVFALFSLNYAALLGLLVGFSVIVPYIGAALVTIPVVVVAYFQFGVTPDFYWVVGAYLLIQVLDGNVLVPLLFSEAVNLHPVAIVIAVLFFGGLWGLWGVFFAIPLATLVNAILSAWPSTDPVVVAS